MIARLKARIEDLGDQFWLRPALVVVACLILAHVAVLFDHAHTFGSDFDEASLVYSGGAEGARSLLGSVASSAIGIASTIRHAAPSIRRATFFI